MPLYNQIEASRVHGQRKNFPIFFFHTERIDQHPIAVNARNVVKLDPDCAFHRLHDGIINNNDDCPIR